MIEAYTFIYSILAVALPTAIGIALYDAIKPKKQAQ